jgi:hypothetical protein
MLNGLVCQSRVAGFQKLIPVCHIRIYLENIDGFVVSPARAGMVELEADYNRSSAAGQRCSNPFHAMR